MTDELPLPDLGPEWTDYWRKKVHDQMRAYGAACAAAAVQQEREKSAGLQAKIDALMLEFCPGEMTLEQVKEWANKQVPAGPELTRAIDAAKLERPCTCHPDDNPPKPCPRQFALTDCRAAAIRGKDDGDRMG